MCAFLYRVSLTPESHARSTGLRSELILLTTTTSPTRRSTSHSAQIRDTLESHASAPELAEGPATRQARVDSRGDGSIPGRFDSQICIDPNRSSALIFHSKYVCGRKLAC